MPLEFLVIDGVVGFSEDVKQSPLSIAESTYEIYVWGKPSQQVKIHVKNGYLYLDETRLIVEFKPGLFFTSDGEAVDFRNTPPTWRNIRLIQAS